MYTVGQDILGGKAVIVTVDANNLILSVSFPYVHDVGGTPLGVTYSFGVTEMAIANILTMVTG